MHAGLSNACIPNSRIKLEPDANTRSINTTLERGGLRMGPESSMFKVKSHMLQDSCLSFPLPGIQPSLKAASKVKCDPDTKFLLCAREIKSPFSMPLRGRLISLPGPGPRMRGPRRESS